MLREERHKHVRRITGLALPTPEEEPKGDAGTERYDAAVALIRPHANQQPVVARANAHYGFWRNLLALRLYVIGTGIVGLIACGLLLVLDLVDLYDTSKPWLIAEVALCVAWLILACTVISEDAVKRAANNYAREVLQSLPLLPSRATDDNDDRDCCTGR